MPELLLRDIPADLKSWIYETSHDLRISQKELVLSVLNEASRVEKAARDQLTLFQHAVTSVEIDGESIPFTFIDLFAGIGGMRLGLQRVGGQCVFSCEWDKYAQKTYRAWHGEIPEGDICQIDPFSIPDHDILAAGFPCQPFSIAGVSKKKSLGLAHGFKDAAQGELFFYLAKVIEAKRPPVILLENVKNLKSHDQGKTFSVIQETLDSLNYSIYSQVIDARSWVPQHRERIFIVGLDRTTFADHTNFVFPPVPSSGAPKIRDILEPDIPRKYTLSDHRWRYLQEYAARHKAAGNGFGYGLAPLDGVSRTLSARYYKDGSEILIHQGRRKNPRRLSPREAARLMGFPDALPIVVSDTQAYKQFGNAVVPMVVEAVGRQIVKIFRVQLLQANNGCLLKKNQSRRKPSSRRNHTVRRKNN